MKEATSVWPSLAIAATLILGGTVLCRLTSKPETKTELSTNDRMLCEQLVYRSNVDRAEDPWTILVTPHASIPDCLRYMSKANKLNHG